MKKQSIYYATAIDKRKYFCYHRYMDKFRFNNDNKTTKRVERFIDKVSFSYHINTFEYDTPHGHEDYWEFTVLTHGKLNNVLNCQKIPVSEGQMFFATTDDSHYLKRVGNCKIRYINIVVREPALKRIADMFSPSFFETLKNMQRKQKIGAESITQIEEIIHQVLLLPEDASEQYNGLICGATMIIMQFLYRRSVDFIDYGKADEQPQWVQTLNKTMKKTEFLRYTVADLSVLLNYSRMQLTRLFNKKFGTTPHKFLVDYKLRYAQNLLMTTDMKVIDIAEFVGFTNLASFNTYFKNAYGTTPGHFRKTI